MEGNAPSSPKSRQRLVVASQALEIQHLQDLVRSRERDVSEVSRRAAADAEEYRKQITALTSKNTRLDNQVQLLADKLRQVETSRESSAVDDVQSMRSLAMSGQERDKVLGQLRDELRKTRNQLSSLVEEREILLEKLVLERAARGHAEGKLSEAAKSGGSLPPGGSRNLGVGTSEAAVQTGSAGSILDSSLPKVPGSGKAMIDLLREHIELEQELLTTCQNECAQHGANVAELHERLRQCLQGEVRKLQEEQDKYSRMMTAYGSAKNNNTTSLSGGVGGVGNGVSSSFTPRTPGRSPIPPPPPTSSATPAAATTAAVSSPGVSSFFHLQEQEMLNLKRRLQELQTRHAETSGSVFQPSQNPFAGFQQQQQQHSVVTTAMHSQQQSSVRLFAEDDSVRASSAVVRPAAVQNSAILQRMLNSASATSR
jgi:hypothetical protein